MVIFHFFVLTEILAFPRFQPSLQSPKPTRAYGRATNVRHIVEGKNLVTSLLVVFERLNIGANDTTVGQRHSNTIPRQRVQAFLSTQFLFVVST
jgi:hypothetical protein